MREERKITSGLVKSVRSMCWRLWIEGRMASSVTSKAPAFRPGLLTRMTEIFIGRRALEESVWVVIHEDLAKLLGRCPGVIERKAIIERVILGMLFEELPFAPKDDYLSGLAVVSGIVNCPQENLPEVRQG